MTTFNNNKGNRRKIYWANRIGCPIEKVAEYEKIVFKEFDAGIARDKETGKYFFEMYRYEYLPSGWKRPLLMVRGNKKFDSLREARRDANKNIISKPEFRLTDFWAKVYDIHPKAIQMLIIDQKQRI